MDTQEVAQTSSAGPVSTAPTKMLTDTNPTVADYSDTKLLALFEQAKKEAFDQRWIFERQWLRNIYYVLGRQWIFYNSKRGEWQDKRLAKWIPRPVTNKCKEGVQAIRAMLTSVQLSSSARPNGNDPKNIATANIADQLEPLLNDEHEMRQVLNEFDWWFIVTGNAFLHTWWNYDPKFGQVTVSQEQCQQCQTVTPSTELVGPQPVCPSCQGNQFAVALDPVSGQPMIQQHPIGRGCTVPLSPLEVAFPFSYARFSDVPFVIRLRWRHRSEYEQYPHLKDWAGTINWQKAPNDRSLQIFRSLPLQNDLGTMPFAWSAGPVTTEEEGIAEYELWMRPSSAYPDGLVLRVVGDTQPQIVHLEEQENVPGPLPYHDAEGNALFPWAHATYEHVGGRILGSGALDPVVQKQDQLNQLDSMFQMIIQRMANPVWLEPKGAEIEKFTGEPGLVIKWNPLTVGGNAKPERIPGMDPPPSFFQLREQYMSDIEQLMGTFDILKGAKPAGVEAFSAMQLLVERGQARFTNAFQSRGGAYGEWYKLALELEREFGPDTRTRSILTPARGWTFKTFQNAQLQGDITIVVEDGSVTPKTSLGKRAAIEHASQLGTINPQDPDTQYAILTNFGLTDLVPSIDVHVQAALQKQQAFEEWIIDPMQVEQAGLLHEQDMMQYQQQKIQAMQQYTQALPQTADPTAASPQPPPQLPPPPSPLAHTPLKLLPWFNLKIHVQEFMKWANSDRIRGILQQKPQAEGLLEAHLQEMQLAMAEQQQGMIVGQPVGKPQEVIPAGGGGGGPAPGGAGMAMSNSRQNSAPIGNTAQPAKA